MPYGSVGIERSPQNQIECYEYICIKLNLPKVPYIKIQYCIVVIFWIMLRLKDNKELRRVAVNAAMGSFLFGYELVNISSLEGLFRNANQLSAKQTQVCISIITASLPLTAIFGAWILKAAMRRIRARMLMVAADVLTIIAILVQDIGLSFWCLLLGRLVLGFTVGINSGLVPQYIYSVTPTALAGSIGSIHTAFMMIGIASGYTMGFLIDPDNVEDQICWRLLLSFPILTCLTRCILLLTLVPYQIPASRTQQKQIQKPQRSYSQIQEHYAQSQVSQSSHDTEFLPPASDSNDSQRVTKGPQSRNLTICLILAFSNQMCGVNAILFYAKQLFMRITDGNNNLSQLLIIVLGMIQVVATLVGGRLMDKFPRRNFLMGGNLLMMVCLLLIYVESSNDNIVIFLILLHTASFSFSVAQLLMYYAAKLLESTGYVAMANWFATFLVAITAEFMMSQLGIGNMCMIFCVLLAICMTILFKCIPTQKQIAAMQQKLRSDKQPTVQLKSDKSISTQSQSSSQSAQTY